MICPFSSACSPSTNKAPLWNAYNTTIDSATHPRTSRSPAWAFPRSGAPAIRRCRAATLTCRRDDGYGYTYGCWSMAIDSAPGTLVSAFDELPWFDRTIRSASITHTGSFLDISRRPMVTIASITDGTSNTMSFSENDIKPTRFPIPWNIVSPWFISAMAPNLRYTGNRIAHDNASSLHPGGVNAGFADGSVHFIKNTINTWPTNSGGNPNRLGIRSRITRTSLRSSIP